MSELALVLAALKGKVEPFDLKEICFKEQLDFINDPRPFVTASCSRRSGKTEVCAMDLINTAINTPEIVCLYITLTRGNAERIIWSKLKKINDLYDLKGEPNNTKLSLTFPNKSVIYLAGCKDKQSLELFKGMAIKLVYLDEVQSFKAFIKDLVDEALGPTLIDYAGKLKLIGTPAPLNSGYFWNALQSDAYSHHHWTFWNNPFITKLSGSTHKDLLDRELKRRGVSINDASIRREWFGEWITDTNALVFKYDSKVNHFDALPVLTDYIVGVDIGFEDSDAIAVIGWHKHKRECYLVEEFIKENQGITELSDKIEVFIKKYNPVKVVMDTGGLGKKIAEEIRKRRSIPIQAAEKTRKIEFIELLNDAMRTRTFMASSYSNFATDCQTVEWDFDKSTPDKLVIKDEPHSDICDAVLYGYREALHWLSEPEKKKPNLRDKKEYAKFQMEQLEKRLEETIQHQKERDQYQTADIGECPPMPGGFDPYAA